MHKLLAAALLFVATPLLAVDAGDCAAYQQLGTLHELRNFALRPHTSSYEIDGWIDQRIDQLRGPLAGGGYRWIRWVRPDSGASIDKHVHTVAAANPAGSDSFEASGDHPFAVKVVVPSKRSLFNKNSPVYVGAVRISATIDGRTRTKNESINAWMNPDTSRTFDLEAIADHAQVSIDASTAAKDAGQSVVEIHFVQARAQDDPANPAYDTVRSLGRLKGSTSPEAIDEEIATLERALFPSTEPVPVATVFADLRRADSLIRSKKPEDQEKGEKLLHDVMKRVRY